MNADAATIAAMRLALRQLTDDELMPMNSAVQTGWRDPRKLAGYDKVKHLFDGTEQDLLKDAFASEVLARYPEYR